MAANRRMQPAVADPQQSLQVSNWRRHTRRSELPEPIVCRRRRAVYRPVAGEDPARLGCAFDAVGRTLHPGDTWCH